MVQVYLTYPQWSDGIGVIIWLTYPFQIPAGDDEMQPYAAHKAEIFFVSLGGLRMDVCPRGRFVAIR